MTAPRARAQADPPSPPDRRRLRRGGLLPQRPHPPAAFARLAGARRGLVRSSRGLAAAALLALSGALALPATAEAQTVTTLDSNIGQGSAGTVSANVPRSQRFTTGSQWTTTSSGKSDRIAIKGSEVPRVPAAPTKFTAAAGDTTVTLSWDPPASGSGVTRHEYRYKRSESYPLEIYPASWTQIANSGTGGTNQAGFTVTGLTNGTIYTFELRAVDAGGDGAAAESGPVKPTVPCAPENDVKLVRGSVNSEGSVEICHNAEWRSVCDDNFSGQVDLGTAFAGVVCRQEGYVTGKATTVSSFGQVRPLFFWLDNVECTGTEAHLGQCAHNGWGANNCGYGERAGVRCTVAASGLTAVGGNEQVSLAWDAPGNDAGITRHEVRYKTTGGYGGWAAIPDSAANEANEASYTVTGLATATDYTFQVRIVGGGNASGPATATARTTSTAASTDATLSGLAVNDGGTDLTLSPGFASGTYTYRASVGNAVAEVTVTPTKNHAGAMVAWLDGSDMTLADADTPAGRQVALAEGDNVIKVKVTAEDGVTTQTYTVTVTRAVSTNDAPEFSGTTATRTVPENSIEGTPVGAPVTATDDDSGDTLTYSLEETDDRESFAIEPASGQIKTKSGVTYDYEATKNSYSVTVKASDGEASDTITVTIDVTDVDEPSAAPAKPTVTMPSGAATSLTVRWSEPGRNGGPEITGYDVRYRVAATGEWSNWSHSGTGTSVTITGLMPGTGYQVQVRAKNGETPSDWSPASDTVSIRNLPVLSVGNASGDEGGAVSFKVRLSAPSAAAVTVVWAASVQPGDTAVAADFANLATARGTLTIPANSLSGSVTVPTREDTTDEENETFTLTLSSPANAVLPSDPTAEGTITDDEASPTVMLSLSAKTINEDRGTTVATATLSHPSSEATTVTLTPAPGHWTADSGGRLSIPAGATRSAGSVTLTAVDDPTDAPHKVLTVLATAVNTQGVAQPAGEALTIEDDEAAPTATLTVSAETIDENNNGAAQVGVALSHPSSEATTVTVSAAGSDPKAAAFTLTGTVLTVPAGQTAGTSMATLTATDNGVDAPDQTVTVMAAAQNTQGIAGDPDDVTLTITDDENAPTVTASLSATTIGENDGFTGVAVELSHPSSEDTVVTVSATPVSPAVVGDFTQSGSVLTVPASATKGTGTVTVAANDNDVDAPDKQVTISATAVNTQGVAGDPAALTLTIEDDDERGFVWSPVALTITEEQAAADAYTVALTSEPTAAVTLTVTTPDEDRLRLTEVSGNGRTDTWTLTFTPQDWDTPQAVSLLPGRDADSAQNTVALRHAATGGDYQGFSLNYAVTITDVDAPTEHIVLSVDRSEVDEGGGAVSLEVTARLDGAALTSAASVAVTVGAGTAAADFTASPASFTLRIAAGSFSASRAVTLTPVDDDLVEESETVRVTGTTTATQEGTTTVLGVTGAEVRIADDDTRGVTVTAADPLEVAEGGSATYTVVLDSQPTGEVTVSPEVTGDSDVTVSPEELTFTATTWRTAQRVTVSAANDDDTADDEATVTHTVSGADYGSNRVPAASVAVTVEDDDSQGVSVSVSRLPVPEGGSATYTVVLDSAPTGEVTVTPEVSGDPDVTVSPARLRFTAQSWSAEQTVTVSAREDADSANDTATVSHTVSGAPGLAARDVTVTVTVTDNDEASTGIALTLSPETVPEGGGGRTVTVTAALDGAALAADTVVNVQVGGGTGSNEASATDFTADPAALALTIRAGTTEATGTFRLTPDNDSEDEGDSETVTVSGTVSGAGAALPVTGAELVIVDDDGRGLEVSRSSLTVEEEGRAEYTVRLASEPAGSVRVTVSVAGNPDVTVMPEELEFTTANWDKARPVMVSAAADPDGDGETATVTHAASGGGYDGVGGGDVAVQVSDNDQASRTVTLTVDPATVDEDGGPVSLMVTATLDGAVETVETVVALEVSGVTAVSGADFAPVPAFTVTVPAGAMQGSGTFKLVPVDDAVDEGASETVTVAGRAAGFAVVPATLTLLDDDDAPSDDARSPDTVLGLSTAVVPGGPVALTARFAEVASEHDGETPFTLELVFSEGIERLSPAAVRDEVLGVTGGRVTGARLAGSGDRGWELTVAPGGTADVLVALAPTADCAAAGAVCTADGRMQSSRLSALVHGPAVVSVADARVRESADATLDFEVRLSRARDAETRVDWTTLEGTARAVADYTAASGTVVFAAGETTRTVSVVVLADAHDEGEETLMLRLSNPMGARLGDAQATGTIGNEGHMPGAWLARFGRTVAEQVVAAAGDRFEASRAPGTEVRLVGQRIGAESRRAAPTDWLRGEDAGLRSREVTGRDILSGSSFALTGGSAAGGFASLWGRGAVSRFDGRVGEHTLDGEVVAWLMGADWAAERWTAGLAVGHARGTGSYRDGAQSGEGEMSTTLTGLYPYGRYAVSGRVTVWGVAGYGAGTLTLAAPQGQSPMEADTDLALAAGGLRAVVAAAPAGGGVELAVKPDALWLRTSSEAVPGLAAAGAGVTRLRLGVEGTWHGLDAGGARLVPSLELGVRHDGGDAETGFGADIGAGLAWSDAKRGIEATLGGRGLLTHEDGGLRERGIAASLVFDPAPGTERGVRLSLAHTMGASASGGADALLARTTMAGLAANDAVEGPRQRRFEATLGYGFAALAQRFTATPEIGAALSQGERSYRLGWRLGLAGDGRESLGLELEGTRREPVDDGAPEHGVALRLNVRW